MARFKVGDVVVMVDDKEGIPKGSIGTVLEISRAPWISWNVKVRESHPPLSRMFPSYPSTHIQCSAQERLELAGNNRFEKPSEREW